VNCVTGTVSTQNVSTTCTTANPGKVFYSGTVSGTPGATVRWYYFLKFAEGSPATLQGEWTTVTLDARGNGFVRFYGWSTFSNTITGSLMIDPMDGGKAFAVGSATGTLTCQPT